MSEVFDAYAQYYDLLYHDKDYGREAEYVDAQLRARGARGTRMLELGSGTGTHAAHLARLGWTVHGVDLSDAMVQRALARQRELPAEIAKRLSFSQGDVRTVATGEKYDVVVSLFHVMSYQTSNEDLEAAFATAARHLNPGGVFLFDCWYGPAVLTEAPEVRVKRFSNDAISVTRIAEPVMHPNDNVVDVNYTVFVEQRSSGKTEQIRETHSMRYLFLPELARYAAGRFSQLSATAWMTSESLRKSDWSACISLVLTDPAKT